MNDRLKNNVVANFFGKFWSAISSFIFIPLYIKFLGIENYSIISFTLVIAGLMSVMDAGLSASLSREFALSTNSQKDKLKIFRTIESCYWGITILIILLILFFAKSITTNWLNLGSLNPEKIAYYIRIMGVGIGFQFLGSFYFGGLIGLQKQVKANIYQISWGILRNALVVLPIIFIPSLELFFIWQTVANLLFAAVLRYEILKSLMVRFTYFIKPKIEKRALRKIWKFALGMLLVSLVAGLNTQVDKLLISNFLDIKILGYYTIAITLANVLNSLVTPISMATGPMLTKLFSERNINQSFDIYSRSFLLSCILVFPIGLVLALYSKQIIFIWTGDVEVALHSAQYLPYIIIGVISVALAQTPYNIAIANAYIKLNNLLGIISLLVSMPAYYYMAKNYGGIGTALVFSVVQFFSFVLYTSILQKRFFKNCNSLKFCIKNILAPLFISLTVVLLSLLVDIDKTQRITSMLWIVSFISISVFFSFLFLVKRNSLHFMINNFLKK